MKVTTVSATIRFSQDTGKGAWKSLEIGAEGILEGGETWTEAQTRLYQDLTGQLKSLWGNGNGGDNRPPADPPPHYCQEHRTPFKRMTKGSSVWYSHRLPNGKYCKES